jgi:hypothetical protein
VAPKGVKIGIVSSELENYSYEDCHIVKSVWFNSTDECFLNKISCDYIDQLDEESVQKHFYQSFDEAHNDAKKGKIAGFVYFAPNFTESFESRRDSGRFLDDATLNNSEIQIYLDQTNQPITFFLETILRDAYKNFSENLFAECQLPKKIGNVP